MVLVFLVLTLETFFNKNKKNTKSNEKNNVSSCIFFRKFFFFENEKKNPIFLFLTNLNEMKKYKNYSTSPFDNLRYNSFIFAALNIINSYVEDEGAIA